MSYILSFRLITKVLISVTTALLFVLNPSSVQGQEREIGEQSRPSISVIILELDDQNRLDFDDFDFNAFPDQNLLFFQSEFGGMKTS